MLSESTIFAHTIQKKKEKDKSIGCLFFEGTSLWGKCLVVAAPLWLWNLKNIQASGHKSNEALDCIFNQH